MCYLPGDNQNKKLMRFLKLFLFVLFFPLASCQPEPKKIRVGKDTCAFCKMTVSDVRFGAEVITKKGKIFKYDDIHCLLSDVEKGNLIKGNIHEIYFTDFCGKHSLINSQIAFLLTGDELKSPMGGNIAAFSVNDSLRVTLQKIKGKEIYWQELFR